MFTTAAFGALVAIGWFVARANVRERGHVMPVTDDEARQSVLHARQELKLIAFLLGAILVMLGVLVDVIIAH